MDDWEAAFCGVYWARGAFCVQCYRGLQTVERGLFEPCSAELCCVVPYTFLSPTLHLVGPQDKSTAEKGKVRVILAGTG